MSNEVSTSMADKNTIGMVAGVIAAIGAINWGLFAINPMYNIVKLIFGTVPVLETIIYIIIAICGIYVLVMAFKM